VRIPSGTNREILVLVPESISYAYIRFLPYTVTWGGECVYCPFACTDFFYSRFLEVVCSALFQSPILSYAHLSSSFSKVEGLVADYDLTLGNLIGIIRTFFEKIGRFYFFVGRRLSHGRYMY
jgi:hypothetical protein